MKKIAKSSPTTKMSTPPVVIPRAEHGISRNDINRNALKVLYRLHEAGYSAFLVGGCVRDLLLNYTPKDFDIATNAHPEQVRRLFRNCRLIGKRFRLAHILFGREIIEVATFRTHHQNSTEQHGKSHAGGMILRDNVYGTIEDDAWRRDFRVNALYYNIADFTVIDYTGGMQDIKDRVLHIIGDPHQRFREDPVRLLRAIRFAAKLQFSFSPQTIAPLKELNHLLQQVSPARLFQEVLKIFQGGACLPTIKLLQEYHLLMPLFPLTVEFFADDTTRLLLEDAMQSTDQRVAEGKPVSPAFLLAVFLWHPVQQQAKKIHRPPLPFNIAVDKAIHAVIKEQSQHLAIPRTIQLTIREIVMLQYRFKQRRGAQAYKILNHPRFRAAYDLLLLRSAHEADLPELTRWWTGFAEADPDTRQQIVTELHQTFDHPKKPRRRRFKKKTNVLPEQQ